MVRLYARTPHCSSPSFERLSRLRRVHDVAVRRNILHGSNVLVCGVDESMSRGIAQIRQLFVSIGEACEVSRAPRIGNACTPTLRSYISIVANEAAAPETTPCLYTILGRVTVRSLRSGTLIRGVARVKKNNFEVYLSGVEKRSSNRNIHLKMKNENQEKRNTKTKNIHKCSLAKH